MKSMHQNKLAPIIILVAFLIIQFCLYHFIFLSNHVELLGTDPFMRLVRVQELYDTKEWYQTTISRSNYPYGENLHWTRALDLLLLIPAVVISPIMGFSKALKLIGIWISPLLGCVLILLLYWMGDPILKKEERTMLLLVFITQPMIMILFQFGRADHHSLLALVFVLALGLVIRIFNVTITKLQMITLGFVLTISIWISVESLILIALVLLVLGLHWILHDDNTLKHLVYICASITIFTLVFLLLESTTAHLFDAVYDKLSFVHLFLFLTLTLFMYITYQMSKRFDFTNIIKRVALLVLFALVCFVVIFTIFPKFFYGPFVDVNGEIKSIWLDHVSEVQPLFSLDKKGIGNLLLYLALPFISTIYLLIQLIKEKRIHSTPLFFFLGSSLYMLLSLYQIRWASYVIFISIIPITQLMHVMLIKLSKYPYKAILRNGFILFYLLGFTLSALILMSTEDASSIPSYQNQLPLFCDWVNAEDNFTQNTTLLAFLDFSPEILYLTDLNVIASPYHRNDEGILYVYELMSANKQEIWFELLSQRKIDYLMIAPTTYEANYYKSNQAQNSLYQLLLKRTEPTWLIPIELPKELDMYQLYEVNYSTINSLMH